MNQESREKLIKALTDITDVLVDGLHESRSVVNNDDAIQAMYNQPAVDEVELDDEPVPAAESVTVASSDVDVRGIVWDARIHASSKALTKEGQWRNRRGVDKGVLAKVEAELIDRAINDAKKEPVVDLQPVATTQVATPTIQPIVSEPTTAPSLVNQTPSPIPSKPAHTFDTFKSNLIGVLAELNKTGVLTQEYMNQLKDYFGVGELWEIFGDDDKIKALYDNFCDIGFIVKVSQ